MIEFRPQPGRQEQFLSSHADIVIYGGAAGGGKTFGLLLEGMRYRDVKGFTASIFRRSYPEITNQGGLWDESEKIYPYAGGQSTRGDLTWAFPKGASIKFNHMQNDDALKKYDGAQLAFIGFDQLEHFSEKQFFYMMMRNRTTCGVKPYIRATCNPDPDSFLVTGPSGWGSGFISWWIDEDGYANLERAGVVRWFVRRNEVIYWADNPRELESEYPGSKPLSVTFIPATVYDNRILLDTNPEYLANLEAQSLVERERFLGDPERGGNWKIKAEAGKVFNREWFEIVPSAPRGGIEGSGWDIAATIQSQKNTDPDYTCRVKMRRVNGTYYVLDMMMGRYAAGEIDNLMLTTSRADKTIAQAQGVQRFIVRWEIEGGSAGQRVNNTTIRLLAGLEAMGVVITGDKVTRAKPFAAQALAGNVKLVAGPWNDAYLAALHGFPDLKHDDPIDGSSVIFNELALLPEPKPQTTSAQERRVMREVFS